MRRHEPSCEVSVLLLQMFFEWHEWMTIECHFYNIAEQFCNRSLVWGSDLSPLASCRNSSQCFNQRLRPHIICTLLSTSFTSYNTAAFHFRTYIHGVNEHFLHHAYVVPKCNRMQQINKICSDDGKNITRQLFLTSSRRSIIMCSWQEVKYFIDLRNERMCIVKNRSIDQTVSHFEYSEERNYLN